MPDPTTGVLLRRDPDAPGRWPCGDRGRAEWVSCKARTPGIAGDIRRPDEASKDTFLRALWGSVALPAP